MISLLLWIVLIASQHGKRNKTPFLEGCLWGILLLVGSLFTLILDTIILNVALILFAPVLANTPQTHPLFMLLNRFAQGFTIGMPFTLAAVGGAFFLGGYVYRFVRHAPDDKNPLLYSILEGLLMLTIFLVGVTAGQYLPANARPAQVVGITPVPLLLFSLITPVATRTPTPQPPPSETRAYIVVFPTPTAIPTQVVVAPTDEIEASATPTEIAILPSPTATEPPTRTSTPTPAPPTSDEISGALKHNDDIYLTVNIKNNHLSQRFIVTVTYENMLGEEAKQLKNYERLKVFVKLTQSAHQYIIQNTIYPSNYSELPEPNIKVQKLREDSFAIGYLEQRTGVSIGLFLGNQEELELSVINMDDEKLYRDPEKKRPDSGMLLKVYRDIFNDALLRSEQFFKYPVLHD